MPQGLQQDHQPNNFDSFAAAVRDTLNKHAERKNYTDNGADGPNKLCNVMQELGIHEAHCIGEIIYKCAEWLRAPRKVLMEKVAGWAFLVWKATKD